MSEIQGDGPPPPGDIDAGLDALLNEKPPAGCSLFIVGQGERYVLESYDTVLAMFEDEDAEGLMSLTAYVDFAHLEGADQRKKTRFSIRRGAILAIEEWGKPMAEASERNSKLCDHGEPGLPPGMPVIAGGSGLLAQLLQGSGGSFLVGGQGDQKPPPDKPEDKPEDEDEPK